MNRMLVIVFDNETAAEAGNLAMRQLDAEGGISLYSLSMIAKAADGRVSIKLAPDPLGAGTGIGLAVGSLIGLLGGPIGLATGAVVGTLVGAVRDYWVAGVGLDFVEDAEALLKPGKVALVAEVEEDWVIPVDSTMEAIGAVVIRRSRTAVAQAQFKQDIDDLKAGVTALENEYHQASGAAKIRLQASLGAAKANLAATTAQATCRFAAFKLEADAKIESLEAQAGRVKGEVKLKVENRIRQVRNTYVERSTLLMQAWSLTKQALSA